MKYLLALIAGCALQACVDPVQLAKREMDSAVLRSSPIQYRNVHVYPREVVCGQYSTRRNASEDKFTPFIYRDGKVDANPTTSDMGIFCADDSLRNLFVITGIDLNNCRVNKLPDIVEDFQAIGLALTQYERDNGSLPRNRQGLEALVSASKVQPIPRRFRPGGYLSELPTDPWGKPYLYKGPVFGGSKGVYTIRTLGADNSAGGAGENADVSSDDLKYIDHIGGCSSGS